MSMSPKPAITAPTSTKSGRSNSASKIPNPQTSAAIALNMSWQLLAVVIVPIVGGHLLDKTLDSGSICMTIGMAVAVVGMVVVVRQAMRELNGIMPGEKADKN